MKRLFFPISEQDYFSTTGRVGHLVRSLSTDFIVDFVTISKEVYEDITKNTIGNYPNLHIRLIESKYLPVTYDFRNDLSRIFVNYTYDMVVPDTDLKMWKTTAFDDFWGHIAACSFPEITKIDADMVLVPLMSHDEVPPEDVDVFYTSIIFMAKEAGIKVAGYQIYPVFNSNMLVPRLMDALIVKREYERQFYVGKGLSPESIHVLMNYKDIYSLSTIEDTYKNNVYNSQIEMGSNELAVVVYNHAKFRPQLREVFKTLKDTGGPVVLSLVKRGYAVRELMEDKIIEGAFFEEIKKINCKFYLVENKSLVPIVMVSDVVISPTYIGPLEFAAHYGKEAWVYNSLSGPLPEVNGVVFINKPDDLAAHLKKAYAVKQNAIGMAGIINVLLGKH